MRRGILGLIIAALMFTAATARAQQPTFAMLGVNGCSGATPFGGAQWCFDSDTTTNPGVWYNNAGVFTLVSGGSGGGANPSFTTVTITGTGDKSLNIANGGHISDPLGTGTLPTVGTGTVAAGGTDNSMRVTGGTSPVTVTFHTAFAVAPVCVCSNGTTAADGCKTSAEGTASVVVTTASTDTFSLICFGK
jgi:hypothetical protein